MPRDHYEVLGVERAADEKEIRKAFRSLARELHPDVNPDPEAEEHFKELAEAYEVLSDTDRRATYDRYGHEGLKGQGWSPGFDSFSNFGDLFSAFFGGGGSGGGPRQGADLGIAVDITLDEAFSGTKRQLDYEAVTGCETCDGSGAEPGTSLVGCKQCGGHGAVRTVQRSPFGQIVREAVCPACSGAGKTPEVPCGDCSGSGSRESTLSVEVDIPAGIDDGQRIRLAGRGNAGSPGAPAGDLYVVIQVDSDERFVRDGEDLVCVVDISMAKAAIGTEVVIPGLDGDIDLHFGMQHHRNGEQTHGLDRHADQDLVTVDLEARLFHRVGDVARRHRTIELAAVAGLTDQDERLAAQLLGDGFGVLLAFQIVGFQMRLLGLEIIAVGLGGPQRLLLGQQEIAGKAVLDADFVAHLAQLFDAFEQDHLHGSTLTSRHRAAAP